MAKLIEALIQLAVFVIFGISILSSIIQAISKATGGNASQTPMQPVSTTRPTAVEKSQRRNQDRKERKQPESSKQKGNRPPKKLAEKEKELGSGVTKHVEQYIGDHVRSHMGRDVDEFVKRDIDERVTSHLGKSESQVDSKEPEPASRRMLAMLKNPDGFRQAILINEILSKPVALRGK